MARITVTVPPGTTRVSGSLFKKIIPKILRSPSWVGKLIIGLDEDSIPIRVGSPPLRASFNEWWLISEDLDNLVISEDSIFSDTLEINSFIKFDGSGQTFSVDGNGRPIINISPDPDNYPSDLSSENLIFNINRNSPIALYAINAPIGSELSYRFSDLTTENINLNESYYSIDFGSTWLPTGNSSFIVPAASYGVVFIYINMPNNPVEDKSIFSLNLTIPDNILYLTAEYGEDPNPAAEGEIISDTVIFSRRLPRRTSGSQNIPIPYGTFKRCLNTSGLAEFYGTSTIVIQEGSISYNYEYYNDTYPLCFR